MIGLTHYLVVGAILFVTGVFGIFGNRKNVIVILMSIELILLSANINFVAFSAHLGDLAGQVFTMFVLTLRDRPGVKRQDIAVQNARTQAMAVETRKVPSRQGVEV